MSALMAGHTASLMALAFGLALLVAALIALAATLTWEQVRKAARGRDVRSRGRMAMDERIKARLEATIWPE
jgi:membrane protein implicated in regulation of membrane protease activity